MGQVTDMAPFGSVLAYFYFQPDNEYLFESEHGDAWIHERGRVRGALHGGQQAVACHTERGDLSGSCHATSLRQSGENGARGGLRRDHGQVLSIRHRAFVPLRGRSDRVGGAGHPYFLWRWFRGRHERATLDRSYYSIYRADQRDRHPGALSVREGKPRYLERGGRGVVQSRVEPAAYPSLWCDRSRNIHVRRGIGGVAHPIVLGTEAHPVSRVQAGIRGICAHLGRHGDGRRPSLPVHDQRLGVARHARHGRGSCLRGDTLREERRLVVGNAGLYTSTHKEII